MTDYSMFHRACITVMNTRKVMKYAFCCLTVFVAIVYLVHFYLYGLTHLQRLFSSSMWVYHSSGSTLTSPTTISKGCIRNVLTNTTFTLQSIETTKRLNRNEDFACSHFMGLSKYKGRTGNHMFQVASLIGTAISHGYTPVLPKSSLLANVFDLPNLVRMSLTNVDRYIENVDKPCIYSEEINYLDHKRNWTLHGYFQSWRYFKNAEAVIRHIFTPSNEYLEEARSFLGNISVQGRSNVCLHYRRGDLLKKTFKKIGYAVADLGYIHRAMEYFNNSLFRNVQFIVLSDGIKWCKEHIRGSNVIFSPFREPASDMVLMTLCDHVIITSGSFGWWGAWLAGGMTVYYKGFPSPNSYLASLFNKTDYYPSDWIGLD